MKYLLHALLAVSLIFSACSSEVRKEEVLKNDTVQTAVIEQPKRTEPASNVSIDAFSSWKGTLNPKNINLGLWLSKKEDLLIGEVVYTSSGKPIKVAGKKEGEYYYLYEFDKAGNVTGMFSFQYANDSLNGTWYSPQNGKQYDFRSSKAESNKTINVDSLFKPMTTAIGTYKYSFGEEGGHGTFTCKEVSPDAVRLDLKAVTPAPAYHIASVHDTLDFELSNVASVLEYQSNGAACRFNIRFFNNFASIDYVENKNECDFGYNAHPTGVYFKVK